MPDFSGASLKLKAEGEEKVLATLDRIDKKAKESVDGFARLSQDELDKASAAFDRLYGKQSRAARQTQQVVEDVAQKVDASVGGMSHSTALGLGELARGFGRVAESGNLSAFAVREFTGAAFRLGGALGAAGLGTGIGIAAIAIGGLVEYFQNAGKKADEMAQHYQNALDRIAHSSTQFQAAQEQQFAFSGDPLSRLVPKGAKESDVDYIRRTEGQLGLAKEAMRIRALLAKLNDPNTSAAEAAEIRAINLHGELTKRVNELDKAVGQEGMTVAIAGQRKQQLNVIEAEALKIAQQKRDEKLDEKSVAEYQNAAVDAILRRVTAQHDLIPALVNEHDPLVALRAEQSLLRYEIDYGNLSIEQRIAKMKELDRVTKEVNDEARNSINIGGTRIRLNVKAADRTEADVYDKEQADRIKESGKKMQREADQIANDIGRTLARGITDGIRTWFSGGGFANGFKALTASILDGLGQMFAQVAEKALIGSQIMQRLVSAISSMNPWLAAAAAGALFAFGQSLRSSSGSGGSGGGYGSGGSLPQIVNTGVVTASAPQGPVTNASSITARPMNQNTIYVIGEDPKAWRQVQERLDQNARRS